MVTKNRRNKKTPLAKNQKTVVDSRSPVITTIQTSKYLLYVSGPECGSEPIELEKGELTIGRDSSCGVTLKDSNVSRTHATVEWVPEDHTFCVKDLDSTNGCFLNEVPVIEALLRSNDKVRIGPFTLTYLVVDEVIVQ